MSEHDEMTIAPVKATRWRNLWFLKDGRSEAGDFLWSSEDAAYRAAEDIMYDSRYEVWRWGLGFVLRSAVSHHMQMPEP